MPKLSFWLYLLVALPCAGQTVSPMSSGPMPRDYRGVDVHVDGIFVTPIPNAPFQATVQIVSQQKLPDGTEHTVQTSNQVGRTSSGMIRNERRGLLPTGSQGMPRLLSVHLYDPNTRMSTFYNPSTRLARQQILQGPQRTPVSALPQSQQPVAPDVVVTDLGTKPFQGVELVGTRKTRTVPAGLSGTGQPIVVTDEYWYSPALSIYLVIRHDDPRTGEQLVAVKDIQRGEPPAEWMSVPADYKVVDETPPPPSAAVPAVHAAESSH